jgi:hypothetical protein
LNSKKGSAARSTSPALVWIWIWICQSRDCEHGGGDGADDGERRAESARGGDLCGDVLAALRAVFLDGFHCGRTIIIDVITANAEAFADIAGRVHDVDVSLALVVAGGAVGPSSACAVEELVDLGGRCRGEGEALLAGFDGSDEKVVNDRVACILLVSDGATGVNLV